MLTIRSAASPGARVESDIEPVNPDGNEIEDTFNVSVPSLLTIILSWLSDNI
jgi:hypothetical protein